ncbi:MAG: type II secretion system F family protein [Actinomycetota bacterium]|nr:type II secretion system F family protein [Actinomycetota bacterium]
MSPQILLIAGLGAIFLALTLLLGTIGAFTAERSQVGRSLAAVRALESAPLSLRRDADRSFEERVLGPATIRLSRLGRRLTAGGQTDKYRRKLELAGSPAKWDTDRVLAFKVLGLLGGLLFGAGVSFLMSLHTLVFLGVTTLATLIGFFAIDMWLYQRAYDRRDRIRKELPDALDLLTISVEAGLAFDSALSQVARNTVGPLAEEFFRVLQEMQIGVGRSEAMRGLGDRTELPELRGFVTAMVQADSFGIPIANVLRIQAHEMRLKRSQRAEEQAQKVPVKILFPLIFTILPALFIVIIGPAAINIIHNFSRLQ